MVSLFARLRRWPIARAIISAAVLPLIGGALWPPAAGAVDCGREGGVSPNIRYVARNTGVDFRDIVIGIVGKVPEAGEALAGVTSFLWKQEGTEDDVFQQMKEYVDALVPELIAQERATQLAQRLAGLHAVLKDYNGTSYGVSQKGQYFTSFLSALSQAEPFFFDPRAPEKTLPYFVPMGTLKILALREQYLYYDRIYKEHDPDQASHLQDLQTAIKTYSAALSEAQVAAMRWRVQDKVGLDIVKKTDWGVLGPTTTTTWTAVDRLCAWQVSYQNNSLSGGELDGEKKAKTALSQRRAQVEFAYGADLDLLMTPAYLWAYMDPTKPGQPDAMPVDVTSGPFGTSGREAPFDDNPADQPITRVVVFAGSRVDGLEVFYGGRSGGLHGWPSGTAHALDMAPGEAIVSAYGRAGDAMDALYFQTNTGRQVGGGGKMGNEWAAAPPQGSEAVLFKVSGRQGSRHLAGLNLTWRYTRFKPLPSAPKPLGTFNVINLPVDSFAGLATAPGVQAVTGDFAGTGRSGIALVGGQGWTTIPVAFSNGDGSFTVTNKPVPDFAKWATSPGVKAVVGHFDDSGRDAIALVGAFPSANIPVAFSNGDGTFKVTNEPVPNFPGWNAASGGATVVVGRLNDSTRDAIALIGGKMFEDALAFAYIPVAYSNGDGSFTYTPRVIPTAGPPAVYQGNFQGWAASRGVTVLTGDFVGNGRTNIALVGGVGWMTLPVATPNKDGSFTVTNKEVREFASWAASGGAKAVAGRFDDSGRDAIALVGGSGWASIPVAFGNKDGSFNVANQSVSNFPAWARWSGVKVLTGDFAGNGRTAIALLGSAGWKSLPVAFPTGGGTFNVTSQKLPTFLDMAAAKGVTLLAGDFAGTGIGAIAAVGEAGWGTIPVAFSTPPRRTTAKK